MVNQTRRPVLGGLWAVLATAAGLAGCHTPAKPVSSVSVIAAPAACADFTVSIYFESYSAAITGPANRLIDAAVKRTRGCDVTGVRVTGLADAPGAPAANLILSRQRADAVSAALHRRGIDKVAFLVAAAGDVGAETAAGQARPLRRRADVQFDLVAPR